MSGIKQFYLFVQYGKKIGLIHLSIFQQLGYRTVVTYGAAICITPNQIGEIILQS